MTFQRSVTCLIASLLTLVGLSTVTAQTSKTTIKVVTAPITNFTPLLIARDKGFFAEENLDVTWSGIAQSAVAVEAVFGGSAQFGGGGVLEPMIARGNGLDLVLAVPSTKAAKAPPDNTALVVLADGPIKGAEDLIGKKASVGLLNGINHVHMMEWLERRKVDPKKVEFLEIPFPQMPDALIQGRLDVVWAVEPFLTVLKRTGKVRTLAYPYSDNIPGMDLTAFMAKESWLKANPAAAIGFKKAIVRATEYLNAAPREEKIEWVAKFTGIKPELVSDVFLPNFTTEFDADTLRGNLNLVTKYKLAKPFPIEEMIWRP